MSEPSIEFYNAAIDAVQAGQLPEALAAVESSLTEDPKDGQTWQLYVVILNALGRTADAEKATAKVREIGLSEVDEHLMNAAEAAGSGNLATALSHYEAALELEPERAEIYPSYALTLMEIEDAEGALAAAEKAVSLAPLDSAANYALGHIHRLAGKKDEALAALGKALASDPNFMIALYEQGMLLAETGKLDQALSNFERFLAIHPEDPSALEAVENVRDAMDGRA